jgi:hypothetical protein
MGGGKQKHVSALKVAVVTGCPVRLRRIGKLPDPLGNYIQKRIKNQFSWQLCRILAAFELDLEF